jgi:hypothetical protein
LHFLLFLQIVVGTFCKKLAGILPADRYQLFSIVNADLLAWVWGMGCGVWGTAQING